MSEKFRMIVFWMLAKHLTWLIMAFFSAFFILVVSSSSSSSPPQLVQMCVHWNSCVSHSFSGVCQGSVLSPVLFAVLFRWIIEDTDSDWCWLLLGTHFVSAVCYADDI